MPTFTYQNIAPKVSFLYLRCLGILNKLREGSFNLVFSAEYFHGLSLNPNYHLKNLHTKQMLGTRFLLLLA